jgi:hypothetical protein
VRFGNAVPSSQGYRLLKGSVHEQARAKELRMELLNSKRLQAHFEEHPADLALLKHDKPLAKTAAASHLKHLPAYLRDAAGMTKASHAGDRGRGELSSVHHHICCSCSVTIFIFM